MAKDTGKNPKQLPINQETLDIIANVIPTSKYFEVRFDHLEQRVDRMKDNIKDFRADVDNRFNESRTEINNRFEQADKRLDEFKNDVAQRFEDAKNDVNLRFEQVDKRFEQVDQRLEQIIISIDRLTDKLD